MRAALAEELGEGVSRRLSSTGGCGVVLRNQGRGQRDRRKTGGAESTGRIFSPAVVLGGNPAAAQAGVAVGGFGEVTGVGAKMLRGLEPTAGRWSGVAAVAQGAPLHSERGGLRWLGCATVGEVGMGRRGCHGWFKGSRAWIAAWRQGRKGRGSWPEISAGPLRGRGTQKEDGEANEWARAISERGDGCAGERPERGAPIGGIHRSEGACAMRAERNRAAGEREVWAGRGNRPGTGLPERATQEKD